MDLEITYPEMALLRELLQRAFSHRQTIDEEIRIKLLEKIQQLEDDYAAGYKLNRLRAGRT